MYIIYIIHTTLFTPFQYIRRNSGQEAILFIVLGLYVVGLVLLLREIFRAYVEESPAPSLSYNTVLAFFMIGSFVSHLIRILEVNTLRDSLMEKTNYIDMNTLAFVTSIMMVCYGMSTFFLVMRSILVFKFFRIINIFHTVLYIALSNLLHFSIFFVVTILIFALAGMIMFGSNVLVFSSFTKSVMSLLAVLTHNMEFLQFQQAAPYLAPIYFMVFYGITYLVLCRIVVAIFIRTMFELRKSKADREQKELATFLWNKFQEWLWDEDEEKKKRKNTAPNYDVVSTKVEEMEAFVNSLLRTMEAGGAGRRQSGHSGPSFMPGPHQSSSSRPASVPNSSKPPESTPLPKSAPNKSVKSTGKEMSDVTSGVIHSDSPIVLQSSKPSEEFNGLEDYSSPPLSPKKAVTTPVPQNHPKPSIEETSFSFITPMKPLSSKKSNSKSPRRAKTKVKKWDQDDIPVLDPDECNTKFLNPKKGPNAATTKNKMKSVPLIPIPPSKDLPDSIRMIPRMMSPNLPSSIQPIINKRVELPPLEKTPQKFAQGY